MNEDVVELITIPSREVRAAFQDGTTVTDLEFLDFWESLNCREMLSYRANAIRMGWLAIGNSTIKFPGTYIREIVV